MTEAGTDRALRVEAGETIRRMVIGLVGVQITLLVVDFLFAYLDLIDVEVVQHLANLAREDGFGTWVGSTQALAVGVVLLAIGFVERAAGRRPHEWWLMSGLFTYIAMDDALEMHERLGPAAVRALDQPWTESFPTYSWQLVFGPLFGAAGLGMAWFLWQRLTPQLRRGIVVAFACFAFAIGLDAIEGVDGTFESMADAIGVRTYTVSHGFKVTEEIAEMFGTTLFLATFATYLASLLTDRTISVTLVPPTS